MENNAHSGSKMPKAIDLLAKRARLLGVKSFIMATIENGNDLALTFQNVSVGRALSILLAGMQQVLDINLAEHPSDGERREVFQAMLEEVALAIKKGVTKIEK